jgi:SAM-dependent methyltransferase
MAVDFNTVKFLFWARKLGASYERTLTLGHMGFTCSRRKLHQAVHDFGLPGTSKEIDRCLYRVPMTGLYADELFRFLGAREIVTSDYSAFEGANYLHDLNERYPEDMRGRFDMVLDGGTLEHIFNYPAALRHCLELLRPGGHFVTITPAHNFMGHGFYQFSPELFFRVFQKENGFTLRKMVLFKWLAEDATFFEVKDPAVSGYRTELFSGKPMLLAVLAQRTAEVPVLARPPQESDYAALWEKHRKSPAQAVATRSGWLWRLRVALNPYWPGRLLFWKGQMIERRRVGPPSLNNHRHFRRLSKKNFHREDSTPPSQ